MKIYKFEEMADLVREYGDSLTRARKNPLDAKRLFKILEEYNEIANECNEEI